MRRARGWILRKFYPDVANYILMRIAFHPDEASKYLYDEYDLEKME